MVIIIATDHVFDLSAFIQERLGHTENVLRALFKLKPYSDARFKLSQETKFNLR